MTIQDLTPAEEYHRAITELGGFAEELLMTPHQRWRFNNCVTEAITAARELERREHLAQYVHVDDYGRMWLQVPDTTGGADTSGGQT